MSDEADNNQIDDIYMAGSIVNTGGSYINTASSSGIVDDVREKIDGLEKRIAHLEAMLMNKKINDMNDL